MSAILSRFAWSTGILIGVLLIVFLIAQVIGDPARLMLGEGASNADYLALREQLGLDEPLHEQFWQFLDDAVTNQFGVSLWQGVPALQLALERIPATLLLAGGTLAIAVPVALVMGVIAVLYPGSIADRAVEVVSIISTSVVEFWFALVLILVAAVWLGWLPTSGYGSPAYLVLPVLTLALLNTESLDITQLAKL